MLLPWWQLIAIAFLQAFALGVRFNGLIRSLMQINPLACNEWRKSMLMCLIKLNESWEVEIKTKNFTGVNYLLNQYFTMVDEGSISMSGIFRYYFVTKRWWPMDWSALLHNPVIHYGCPVIIWTPVSILILLWVLAGAKTPAAQFNSV